jgi:hypothetical protein
MKCVIVLLLSLTTVFAAEITQDPAFDLRVQEIADKMHEATLYPCIGVMISRAGNELSAVTYLANYNTLGACDDKQSCEKAGDAACRMYQNCGVKKGTGMIEDLAAGNGSSCSFDCACNGAKGVVHCYKPTGIIDECDPAGER